jgi:hypothetical protein
MHSIPFFAIARWGSWDLVKMHHVIANCHVRWLNCHGILPPYFIGRFLKMPLDLCQQNFKQCSTKSQFWTLDSIYFGVLISLQNPDPCREVPADTWDWPPSASQLHSKFRFVQSASALRCLFFPHTPPVMLFLAFNFSKSLGFWIFSLNEAPIYT